MQEPNEEMYLNKTVIEYRVISLNDKALPQLGIEGWEMCGVTIDKMYFKKKVIKKVPRKLTEHETLFEQFWTKYPKKVGKIKVEQKFMNMTLSDARDALAGLLHYLKVWDKDIKLKNIKYIPNPETWINGKRWQDEVEVPKETLSHIRAGEMRDKKEQEEKEQEEQRRLELLERSKITNKIQELEQNDPKYMEDLREEIRVGILKQFPSTKPELVQKQVEILLRTKIKKLFFKQ